MWYVHSVHMCKRLVGDDTRDALSCRSFPAKEPLIIGLFCGKWHTKIRHPMGFRHPVHVQGSKDVTGLKLNLSLRQRATNYRALLRKMTHKEDASYRSSQTCRRFSAPRIDWCVILYVYVCICIYIHREAHTHTNTRTYINVEHMTTITHTMKCVLVIIGCAEM